MSDGISDYMKLWISDGISDSTKLGCLMEYLMVQNLEYLIYLMVPNLSVRWHKLGTSDGISSGTNLE